MAGLVPATRVGPIPHFLDAQGLPLLDVGGRDKPHAGIARDLIDSIRKKDV
jgi:hypothetical protein